MPSDKILLHCGINFGTNRSGARDDRCCATAARGSLTFPQHLVRRVVVSCSAFGFLCWVLQKIMRFSHLLLALLVCVAWGLNAVAAKIGVTYIPPVFFTGLRFIFVLICLLPWFRPVPGKWGVLIPAVFFMGGLHFALIFSGAKYSDASTMSIVNQLYVPISVLLALFWLGETVPLRRWIGIVVAFCGVVVFSLDANHTAHGLGVATMMPYVMTYNSRVVAAEMAEIGAALGLEAKGRSAEEMADATIGEIRRLFATIGITPTLADLGLPADKLDWTADQALGIDRLIKNNPRPFDLTAMRRLIQAAHDGDLAACAM